MNSERSLTKFTSRGEITSFTLLLPVDNERSNPQQNPFPFHQDLSDTLHPNHLNNYYYLLNCDVEPKATPYPDLKELKNLGLFNDIFQKLLYAGLGLLIDIDPGTYPPLVMEFMSTLEVRNNEYNGVADSWRFQLGGTTWTCSRSSICKWLGIANKRGGINPNFNEESRSNFWGMIADSSTGGFRSRLPSSMIIHPVWKIMHHLIANVINVRADEGQTVTAQDLDILLAIHNKTPLDLFDILSTRFIEYTNRDKPLNLAMGGGSFITKLAMGLGFTFNHPGCSIPETWLLNFRASGNDLITLSSSSNDNGGENDSN